MTSDGSFKIFKSPVFVKRETATRFMQAFTLAGVFVLFWFIVFVFAQNQSISDIFATLLLYMSVLNTSLRCIL